MTRRDLLVWWGPVLAWASLIFILSHTPNLQISDGPSDFWLRKTAHMVVYGVLFLLTYRGLIRTNTFVWRTRLGLIAFLVVFVYAISDELHQSLVPTRHGSWIDVGIDTIGVVVTMTGLAWLGWWKRVLAESEQEASPE